MRRPKRLRDWLAELRMTPEERREACADRCQEVLFDSERGPAAQLGEPEEAAIEAERRRWVHSSPGG
jgi:hypothetical protein